MPLAPAYDWVEIFVTTDDFMEAAQLAQDLANEDGILKKLVSVYEAPTAHAYFQRVAPHVDEKTTVLGLMIAPHSMDGFLTFLARRPTARMIYRSDDHDWPRNPGPVYEYSWNHTTLRALKVDPEITYLQVRFAGPKQLAMIEQMQREFSPEVLHHLEVMRESGKVIFAGLSMVKFSTEERLDEIIARHEAIGAMVFNPHRYTLEEGGRQTVDDRQLQFKKEADPKGLLNPGKMIAWDDPNWDYSKMYAYPKLQAAE